MVIDVHAHYIPTGVFEENSYYDFFNIKKERETETMYVNKKNMGPVSVGLMDLDRQLQDMDQCGIDLRFVSLPPFLFNYEDEKCPAWSTELNHAFSQETANHKDRFRYLATLPMSDVQRALQELETVIKDPLCAGIEIATNIAGMDLDNQKFDFFWGEIAKKNVFVLLHPHYTIRSPRLDRFYLRNVIGNPLDTTIAAFVLMTGNVIRKYPNISICLSHAGGYTPYAIARFEHARKTRQELKNVDIAYQDGCKHFYYDTVLHDAETLQFVKNKVTAARLLMGTDYPFDMGDNEPVHTISSMDLSREEKDDILGGNVIKALSGKGILE